MSIIITGATGQLGSRVIGQLLKQEVPAEHIVALVRHPEKAAHLAELGLELRYGDYNDRFSLQSAFAGADKLLFIPSPDAHDETLRLLQHTHVAIAARDAGVPHIVYYGYAFAEESKLPLAATHLLTEGILRSTGIPYTFLRNPLYADVFLDPQSLQAAAQYGTLKANTGEGAIHSPSRYDLARAGAAVLTGEGHENKTYELVLGRTWTFRELADAIASVAGKPVGYEPITSEENQALLVQAGLPKEVAGMLSGINDFIASGGSSRTGKDLEHLIGEPTPLQELVREGLAMKTS
ncbi:SDR family oxidoreductase [Paenibacillus daejeonensis]|uniref:SDR family oxidoreductase n=1 Tax=Paenibacillus daejeonensis TaxID=135193 RepID=UPI000364E0BA|nr:SDR family oxidoreductase [Paenibacillus daejeonensis]